MLRCSRGVAVDLLYDDELIGLIDVGELDLTASRNATQHDPRMPLRYGDEYLLVGRASRGDGIVLEQLRTSITPEIVAKVNDLERFGMIPARLSFVRELGRAFGNDVLLRTTLPWITVVEPPGNIVQRSRQSVAEKVGGQDQIVCGVGLSAGGLYAIASKVIGADIAGKVLLFPVMKDEVDIGYTNKSKLLEANSSGKITRALNEIVSMQGVTAKLVFLRALLDVVAAAWDVRAGMLEQSEWTLQIEKEALWAVLDRSKLVA